MATYSVVDSVNNSTAREYLNIRRGGVIVVFFFDFRVLFLLTTPEDLLGSKNFPAFPIFVGRVVFTRPKKQSGKDNGNSRPKRIWFGHERSEATIRVAESTIEPLIRIAGVERDPVEQLDPPYRFRDLGVIISPSFNTFETEI
mgnify:CR=1 FL=1